MGSILWTIIIGAIVGAIAKFIMPGKNEPQGFVLTAILGIVGALIATYGGQALGFYGPNQSAGFIASLIGCNHCACRLRRCHEAQSITLTLAVTRYQNGAGDSMIVSSA